MQLCRIQVWCHKAKSLSHLGLSSSRGLCVERRLSDDHLVQNDPHGPPVAGLGVALLQKDFRRDVVGRSYERVRHAALQLLPAPPLERLHPVGHVRTRAAAVLQVLEVGRVHRVLTVMVTS